MKPIFNFQFSKGFAKLCFNTCFLNQNKNWSVGDEIFHSKTSINIHLIKIYHNPVSVLNWDPMQTHRGRNKRDKQRERGARETNRKRQWSDLETQIQRHSNAWDGAPPPSLRVLRCVCVRERDRDRDRDRQEQRREKLG